MLTLFTLSSGKHSRCTKFQVILITQNELKLGGNIKWKLEQVQSFTTPSFGNEVLPVIAGTKEKQEPFVAAQWINILDLTWTVNKQGDSF